MRTIETKLFLFSELNDDAKQKAVDKLIDINVDHDWWCFTYDDAREIGLKLNSFDLDRNKHATGEFLYNALEVAADILKYHGEQCETYKTASNFLEDHAPIFAEYLDENSEKFESQESEDELTELEEQFLNDLLEDYANILQKESEYLQSDEAIIDVIESNEYKFDEFGNLH